MQVEDAPRGTGDTACVYAAGTVCTCRWGNYLAQMICFRQVAQDDEIQRCGFHRRSGLAETGLGYVDVHLLASAQLMAGTCILRLATRDFRELPSSSTSPPEQREEAAVFPPLGGISRPPRHPPSAARARASGDSQGRLWIVNETGGTSQCTITGRQLEEMEAAGERPRCYSVYVDDRDGVWLTTSRQCHRALDQDRELPVLPVYKSGANVRQMAGRPGEAWAGIRASEVSGRADEKRRHGRRFAAGAGRRFRMRWWIVAAAFWRRAACAPLQHPAVEC